MPLPCEIDSLIISESLCCLHFAFCFQEAEAFAEYNRALGLQRSGDGKGAERVFSNLLQHPFLQKV